MQSCLNLSGSYPTTSDLERLLDLLLFCQKYEIVELEAHVLDIVLDLTHADNIKSHLTKSLSIYRVVEISDTLSEPAIAESARDIILLDIWSNQVGAVHHMRKKKQKRSSRVMRDQKDPADFVDVLFFGERMRDTEIIGAAYYQILVYARPRLPLDKRLVDRHRRHLEFGMKSCAEEWQQILDGWALGSGMQSNSYESSALFGMLKAIAAGKFAYYDVVGKLEAVRAYAEDKWGSGTDKFLTKEKLQCIKASLYSNFALAEVAPDSEVALGTVEAEVASITTSELVE